MKSRKWCGKRQGTERKIGEEKTRSHLMGSVKNGPFFRSVRECESFFRECSRNWVFSCLAGSVSCLILISFHTGFGTKWKNFLVNYILAEPSSKFISDICYADFLKMGRDWWTTIIICMIFWNFSTPLSRAAECQSFYTKQNLPAKFYPKESA